MKRWQTKTKPFNFFFQTFRLYTRAMTLMASDILTYKHCALAIACTGLWSSKTPASSNMETGDKYGLPLFDISWSFNFIWQVMLSTCLLYQLHWFCIILSRDGADAANEDTVKMQYGLVPCSPATNSFHQHRSRHQPRTVDETISFWSKPSFHAYTVYQSEKNKIIKNVNNKWKRF